MVFLNHSVQYFSLLHLSSFLLYFGKIDPEMIFSSLKQKGTYVFFY